MARIFPEKMPSAIILFVIILSIWSGLMALHWLIGAFVAPERILTSLPAAVIILIMLYSIKYLLKEMRPAWFIVLAVLVIISCYLVTVIALNLVMFFNGAELYRDSPGTIFAVFGIAIIGLLPNVVLLALAFIGRKYILDLKNKEI